MNETNGYIKLYRKLVQWGWYKNYVVKDLFIHCLCRANFTDQPFEGMIIKKGQFVTSIKNLAEELGFSQQQIRTAIKKLKSTCEITSESTNKFTIITVVNWEKYQNTTGFITNSATDAATGAEVNEQQTNNKQITNEQQQYKNDKKEKNVKKDKNIIIGDNIPEEQPKRKRFIPPTLEAVQAYCLERGNNVDAQRFINYYTANGWKVGRNPMKDWKAAVRTWEQNAFSSSQKPAEIQEPETNNPFLNLLLQGGYADD